MVRCKGRPTKGGGWHIPAFMNALKECGSMYRLLSRRKAPHMYLKIENLQKATSGIYLLVGSDKHGIESHAVAVDANQQPPIFLSGLSATAQTLNLKNLRSIRYPLHNLFDIAQIMVRQ
jgi:hypothetical protein